jgi:hypothetical protein
MRVLDVFWPRLDEPLLTLAGQRSEQDKAELEDLNSATPTSSP